METTVETYVDGFHDKDAVEKMKYNPLGETGLKISSLGYGGSGLASIYRSVTDKDAIHVVREAVSKGINYIDTAPWYGFGKSEKVLGMAFKNIPRESYYIATKVGRYSPEVNEMFDFSAERTKRSVDESLERMGLEYVDIIQVHDMEFAPSLDVILNETLPALQEIKDSGKARFIGITGYPLENFRVILEQSKVKIDTILSYCRGFMVDSSLKEYIPYFQEKKVGILNASPIGMGLLCSAGPPTWHPATQPIRDNCQRAVKYCQNNDVEITKLALKYSLDMTGISSTIISNDSSEVLNKNLELQRTPLTIKEQDVYQQVMERFMERLKGHNWEGIEVKKYRESLLKNQPT